MSSCSQPCMAVIAWPLHENQVLDRSHSSKPFHALQRRVLIGSAAATAGVVAAYRHDLTQLQFDFFSALGPFLRLLDAETSHNVAIWTAKQGITPQVLLKLHPANIACRLLLCTGQPVGILCCGEIHHHGKTATAGDFVLWGPQEEGRLC